MINSSTELRAWQQWTYAALMRVRPAVLADAVKHVLHVRRVPARDSSGLSFLVDPVSQFGQCLLAGHSYERRLVSFIRRLVRPGDTVIDAGANEGYISVVAAASGARVLAVEPQGQLGEVILQNAARNQVHDRILVINEALGAESGQAVLPYTPTTNTGTASLVMPPRIFAGVVARLWGARGEPVSVATLDDVIERTGAADRAADGRERVRLLKIDVEGFEAQVIRGARRSLARNAFDTIVVDYHENLTGRKSVMQTHQTLLAHGYRFLAGKHGGRADGTPDGMSFYATGTVEADVREADAGYAAFGD